MRVLEVNGVLVNTAKSSGVSVILRDTRRRQQLKCVPCFDDELVTSDFSSNHVEYVKPVVDARTERELPRLSALRNLRIR